MRHAQIEQRVEVGDYGAVLDGFVGGGAPGVGFPAIDPGLEGWRRKVLMCVLRRLEEDVTAYGVLRVRTYHQWCA